MFPGCFYDILRRELVLSDRTKNRYRLIARELMRDITAQVQATHRLITAIVAIFCLTQTSCAFNTSTRNPGLMWSSVRIT